MKLVFSWIQWCWKWTQARLLVEKYWYTLLEMWQELRNIIASRNELWNKIKSIIEAWFLVTPDIVCAVMKEVLKNQKSNNIILDWFVRNEWNKKCLEKIVPDFKVVYFNLSKDKAIQRLLWRMYNPKTWETYPYWTKIDPKTWDELIKRKDDNEKSILKRIDEYMKSTLPTIELQIKEWKVIEVDADQTIEEVGKEMIKKLGL
jgi:adenylate kinase